MRKWPSQARLNPFSYIISCAVSTYYDAKQAWRMMHTHTHTRKFNLKTSHDIWPAAMAQSHTCNGIILSNWAGDDKVLMYSSQLIVWGYMFDDIYTRAHII